MNVRPALSVVCLLVATPVAQAGIIASEDFDGGAVGLLGFSQSLGDTILGAGDMFGIRDRSTIVNGFGLPFAISDDSVVAAAGNSVFPSDAQGIVGQNKTDKFFGVVDLDNPDNPSGTASAVWNFDISGATGLSLSIDVGAMGDFESSDAYRFSYSIDGGASVSVFDFLVNEAINQTYRAMDSGTTPTINDPLIWSGVGTLLDKTVPATGVLDTFTAAVLGSGSVLQLTLDASGDGGNEAFAFDNILIEGERVPMPAPATIILIATGMVMMATRRRRSAQFL